MRRMTPRLRFSAKLARVLDLPPDRLDRASPLNRLGVDSLMAAELRGQLRRQRGYDLTIPQLLKTAGLRDLAAQLLASDPASDPRP